MESLERAQRSLDKAQELCTGLINDLVSQNVDTIAELGRAVLAERERCAKIAENHDKRVCGGRELDMDWHHACREIAAAIRSGK